MAGGRPSDFSPEIANEICERLGKGESLRSICGADRDDFLPSVVTVTAWLARGEKGEEPFDAFLKQYAHAREAQADTKFEQAWEIANAATPETVQVARLKVDTIKWQTSKLAPKRYGEKVQQEISGADGGPLQVIINKPA